MVALLHVHLPSEYTTPKYETISDLRAARLYLTADPSAMDLHSQIVVSRTDMPDAMTPAGDFNEINLLDQLTNDDVQIFGVMLHTSANSIEIAGHSSPQWR